VKANEGEKREEMTQYRKCNKGFEGTRGMQEPSLTLKLYYCIFIRPLIPTQNNFHFSNNGPYFAYYCTHYCTRSFPVFPRLFVVVFVCACVLGRGEESSLCLVLCADNCFSLVTTAQK